MKINRNNYEAYFIDYLEGNLDEALVDDFIEFLTQNPDLKEELSLFESVMVQPDEINYGKKEQLFHHSLDSESEFNYAAIAKMEGDLTVAETAEFDLYIESHPEKLRDIDLFTKTKLVAPNELTFSKKNLLYRRPISKTIFLWSARAAAVILFTLSIYWLTGTKSENNIAQTETKVEFSRPVIKETPKIETRTDPTVKTLSTPVIKERAVKKETANIEKPEHVIEAEQNFLAETRNPVENMITLEKRDATFISGMPEAELQVMTLKTPAESPEERYFAEMVAEKSRFNNFSLKKVARAGLDFVARISDNKFTYKTDNKNQVKEVDFESRLLAFTIPTAKSSEDKTARGE